MRATWLLEVLESTGEEVDPIDFWAISGRPTGLFNPQGVLIHHTGTASSVSRPWPTKDILIRGRSDLPGPLCHVSPDYNGVLHLIASGRANHAGVARASGPCPAGDGNELYIGFELDYSGNTAPSEAQYWAAVRGSAAILKKLGKTAHHCRAHRETSVTGKWDPGQVDMDEFRFNVNLVMTREDDDVNLTDTVGTNPATGKPSTVKEALDIAKNYSFRAWELAYGQQASIAALTGAIKAMNTGEDFDEEKLLNGIREATKQGILDAGEALRAVEATKQ